jgi:hypothetical protein
VLIWGLPFREGLDRGVRGRTYTTSFAIALSARPIQKIGKIWADGKEFRDSAGNFGSGGIKMRVYDGMHSGIDPIILAAEGPGKSPAYTGLSYVVFENFPLYNFGNRIPNLNFEVICENFDNIKNSIYEIAQFNNVAVDKNFTIIGYKGYICNDIYSENDFRKILDLSQSWIAFSAGFARIDGNQRFFQISSDELILDNYNTISVNKNYIIYVKTSHLVSLSYSDIDRDYETSVQSIDNHPAYSLAESYNISSTASLVNGYLRYYEEKSIKSQTRHEFILPTRWINL